MRGLFEAWALPEGIDPPRGGDATLLAKGARVRVAAVDAAWVGRLARTLRAASAELRGRSVRAVAASLGRVGARFLDEADPIRARALELMPAESGLSPAMASAVLDGMAADWTEDRLVELLRADLGDPAALDRLVETERGGVRALGPELCVQVVSGSVPGVGATALVRSLLVKAPTLLKPGRGDVALPVLMAQALREEDPILANAAGVVYWRGGQTELEDAALERADAVVAYGGDEVVRGLRERTPVTARFVGYHHRVSAGVVGRAALTPEVLHRTASEVAGAAAFFDQRGCVSPQVVYVEEGGALAPSLFARELAVAFAALEKLLPGGHLESSEAAALHQVRGSAELLEASGSGVEVHHGGAASWTVVYDPTGTFPAGCVGRVVRVVPVADVLGVAERLAPAGAHLQTVGVAGCTSRMEALAESLARAGASRVTPFGRVPFPPPWWHHDGQGPLRALVRWTDVEA
jgi:hypothetical protein